MAYLLCVAPQEYHASRQPMPVRSLLQELPAELWFAAHRIGSYVVLYLLDDPALLAMSFC